MSKILYQAYNVVHYVREKLNNILFDFEEWIFYQAKNMELKHK